MRSNTPVPPALTSEEQELIHRSSKLESRLRRVHALSNFLRKLPLPKRERWARRISRSLLPPLDGKLVCPTTIGFRLVISPGDGANYYYDGNYELGTLRVMSHCLRKGDTFLDVGASVGQMSLHASGLVGPDGRVLAFEPHPVRGASLRLAIAINERNNITVFHSGLASEPGPQRLYTERVSPSMISTPSAENGNSFVDVEVLTLDSALKNEQVGSVRMMKIDVEGFELEVLRGGQTLLKSKDAPILCMEHEMYENSLANLEFLASVNDYRFYNLRKRKGRMSKLFHVRTPSDVRRRDNVFCFLPGHIAELGECGLFEQD